MDVTSSVPQLLVRLDEALITVEAARVARDESQEWHSCRGSLELLHSIQDAAKATLRAVESTSDDGKTFAALTWFRNAVHHQHVNPQVGRLVPTKVQVVRAGRLVPVEVHRVVDGSLKPLTVSAARIAWPSRSTFPPDLDPKHKPDPKREGWYDQFVDGHEVSGPLRNAQRFLAATLPTI